MLHRRWHLIESRSLISRALRLGPHPPLWRLSGASLTRQDFRTTLSSSASLAFLDQKQASTPALLRRRLLPPPMNGTRSATARRGGSSFGPGPRRGTDPEGGERSAWKGLTGPSGLNLDHARIPTVQKQVFDTLTPLVVAVSDPIPLGTFTQKCCDLLLPLLERQRELGAHEFKSQWGRLNEFVCPELARLAGIGESGYSREHKTVKIDLKVPGSTQPAGRRASGGSSVSSDGGSAPPGFLSRPAPAPGAGAVPAAGLPMPMQLHASGAVPMQLHASGAAPGVVGAAVGAPVAAPGGTVSGLAVLPPAPCAYCQGPHSMKNCHEFHAMLQTIYAAGYQQGVTAGQQMHGMLAVQAAHPAPPASS